VAHCPLQRTGASLRVYRTHEQGIDALAEKRLEAGGLDFDVLLSVT
jgi:hypothetical protein